MALSTSLRMLQLLFLMTTFINITIFRVTMGMQPPPELLAFPRQDVPYLVTAGADRLMFRIHVRKINGSCPNDMYWFPSINKGVQNPIKNKCTGTFEMKGLNPNTSYQVQVKPIGRSSPFGKLWSWYMKDSQSSEYSPLTTAQTCSRETPAVRDLRVHSMGEKWVALSWLLPQFNCFTKYKYYFRYQQDVWKYPILDMPFISRGSFWSDHVWHSILGILAGDAVPCPAWPDRHCLVIDDLAGPFNYKFEIYVNRMTDNVNSSTQEVKSFVTDKKAPGPPQDLRCVRAEPTALELRWNCPLSPGGILTHFYVLISTGDNKKKFRENLDPPSLRPQYNLTITQLQPGTHYNVSVWFITSTGIRGEEDSIMVWTAPAEDRAAAPAQSAAATPATAAAAAAATATASVETSTCRFVSGSVDVDSQQLQDKDRNEEFPWKWIVACGVLGLLVFVSFFAGRRCGMVRQWKPTPQNDSQNNNGGKTSQLGNARLTMAPSACEVEEVEEASRKGDKVGLCAQGAPPSRTSPIYASAGYAEVDLYAGNARMVLPQDRPTTVQDAHDYDEIEDRSNLLGEAPYATISNHEAATSPSLYSAVQRPAPPPPTGAAKPNCEYAQVDKSRKVRAGRSPPLPPPPEVPSAPTPSAAPADIP